MKRPELLRKIYWTAILLVFFVLLVIIAVTFLNPTSVGNPGFVSNLTLWAVVWAINFIVALVLLFVLARNLIKLFFEYQTNRTKSRLKRKLVLTLTIFSLLPALILFFLAYGLINQNLKLWFSAPSEQLLESAEIIASKYYKEKREVSLIAARSISREIDWTDFSTKISLSAQMKAMGFDGLLLVDHDQKVKFQKGDWSNVSLEKTLSQIFQGREHYSIAYTADADKPVFVDKGLVAIPILGADKLVQGGLVASFILPESVAFHTQEVQTASEKYLALVRNRKEIEVNYYFILAVTTMALIFAFVWLGTYMARKITVPLEALALGAGELAEGNFNHRVNQKAADELGILVEAFNRMADEIHHSRQKLEQANAKLRKTNEQLDERRRYIETILENITTGVVSVDQDDVIRTANKAALEMFGAGPEQILDKPMGVILDQEVYSDFKQMKERVSTYTTDRRRINFKRGQWQLPVSVTVTSNSLPFKTGVGHLVVLDDLTELIRAEKFAAWQEVAKRLAHEIKNPLTPIQLCADRVQNRFNRIEGCFPRTFEIEQFGEILKEANSLIITEANRLKSMVEEFSQFARLPICNLIQSNLATLVTQTLSRYDGALERVNVDTYFDPQIGHMQLDPVQIQRVFVNLIENSLDALNKISGHRQIGIRSHYNQSRSSVVVEFEDNGTGIAPEDYEHLFLPYFSTKKKGTGLGLAIVRQIISEHNGFIRAEQNNPTGTRFIMEFPTK